MIVNNIIKPVITSVIRPLVEPGLVLQLDASDASTITESAGLVSQWNDKNEGLSFIQLTGPDQPLTGVNDINGLNVISFDGTNDNLIHTGALGISGSNAGTIFIVSRIGVSAPFVNTCFSFGNVTFVGGEGRALDINSDNDVSGYRFNNGNRVFSGNPWGVVASVSTWTWADGATYGQHDLYVNGLLQAEASSGNPGFIPNAGTDEIIVGAQRDAVSLLINFGEIDVGEIIVFPRQLSSIERATIESSLSTKWGI